MILDSNLAFDPAGTSPWTVGTIASTNVLDMVNAREMGIGEDLKVSVIPAGTWAGGGTMQIQLQSAPDNGSGSPGAWTTAAETDAFTAADLNSPTFQHISLVGFDLPERRPGAALPRFYRLAYVIATSNFTAGTLQAFVNLARDQNQLYPSGFTVPN